MPVDPHTAADPGRAGRSGGEPPGRRDALVNLLRASSEPRTILSLAEELGVHANTVRFHLDVLLRTGQVEQVLGKRTGPGRPPVLFRATHRMDPAGPTNYRLLASILTDHLASSADPTTTATELGQSWGPHLVDVPAADASAKARSRSTQVSPRMRRGEALTQMTSVLTDLGFAPEPPAGPRASTIRLRHCPFLDLVTGADMGDGYGEVICSLHLGLMQGALASLHASVTVERLDPFVEPDLCIARLAPVGATGHGGKRRRE
jgi:predicted ArsR family transcriptional regulator